MKEIGSYSAKTHLPNLLESVLHGESFIITRRGQPIAILSPIPQNDMTPAQAAERIRELRQGITWGGAGSTKEAKEEGRK
jgi:antitoxin (DNA-binding transcriptional repressor) of toxin-antitoxin stability system